MFRCLLEGVAQWQTAPMAASSLCTLLVLSSIVSSVAASGASPFIDPLLKEQARRGSELTAIFVFKSPRGDVAPLRRASRPALRSLYRTQALKSQSLLIQRLARIKENRSTTKKIRLLNYESLWVSNSVIATLPSDVLPSVVRDPNLFAVYSDRSLEIVEAEPAWRRRSTSGRDSWALHQMQIPQLRKKFPNLNGKGVRVAILDSGIDPNHPEFKGKAFRFKDFVNGRALPYDDRGHGTIVSGVLLSRSLGVAPEIDTTIVKTSRAGNAPILTLTRLLRAMDWVADPDRNPATEDQPQVVSNAWAWSRPQKGLSPEEDVLCRAVGVWANLGIFSVFPAGNSGPMDRTILVPAGCPSAFAVGAIGRDLNVTSFSSRGSALWKTVELVKPEVVAPGLQVPTTTRGGGYIEASGTSLSAPLAAGVAALVFQAYPNISVEGVRRMIVDSALVLEQPRPNNTSGWGSVDALTVFEEWARKVR